MRQKKIRSRKSNSRKTPGSEILQRDEAQASLREHRRRYELSTLGELLSDPRRRDDLARQLEDETPESVETKLERRHGKLVAELKRESKKRGRLGPQRAERRSRHRNSQRALPDWLRLLIELIHVYSNSCAETGLIGLTQDASLLDFDNVQAGSFANGSIQPSTSEPGWLEYSAQLFDADAWWREDAPDTFALWSSIHFETPAAPCDGTLRWDVTVAGLIRWFGTASPFDATAWLGVFHVVDEDVADDQTPGTIPVASGHTNSLVTYTGDTAFNVWSAQSPLGGDFQVNQGQVSRIYCLCIAAIAALDGYVLAEGGFSFFDPNVTSREWPTGLRYTYTPA